METVRAFASVMESGVRKSLDVEAEREKRLVMDEINAVINEIPLPISLAALTAARDEYRKTKEESPSATSVQAQPALPSDEDVSLPLALVPTSATSSTVVRSISARTKPIVARTSSRSLPSTTLVNLPTSSDTFFRLNLIFLLFFTILQHELAVLTSMTGSNGDDLRYMSFSQLAADDVELVGRGFYACAFANSGPYSAVEEFIGTFYFLKELDENCFFFRKVMDCVALVIFFQRSSFGANFRLYFGAGLSVTDMVTDVTMIIQYIQAKQWGFAKSLLIMLSLCMCLQLLIAFAQNRKKGARAVLFEMLITLLCVSPGVHAYRVASGQEKHGSDTVNPRTLLIYCKCIELVFEAVPGSILQLFAYLTLAKSSRFALVSIATSAMTTAFSVSVMYFDKDIDPECRSYNPLFYGVFPDDATSRTFAFFWLFMFSLVHVLSKGFGVALFWATFGGNAVCIYYGAEMVVFFVVKAVHSDLISWCVQSYRPPPAHPPYRTYNQLLILPHLHPPSSLRMPVEGLVSNAGLFVLSRFAGKVLTDFTGYLQMRHSYELGGRLWTMSLLWSQLSAVVFVVLYQLHYDEGEGDDKRRSKIDATAMYITVASLVLVWLFSFSSFIRKINQKYLHTFFGTMTGPQYTVHLFRTGTTDRMKMDIFTANVLHWVSIRDEVIAYTHANWARLKAEKPDWFTDHFINTIPSEFIPRADPNRRRSSAFLNLLGLADEKEKKTKPTNSDQNTSKVAAE